MKTALLLFRFSGQGVPPLGEGMSLSETWWPDYDAGMMRVLTIFLALILAQTLVFFIAGCFAGSGSHKRENEPRHRAANSARSADTQKG